MNDLSECCEAPMTTLDNSDGAYFICTACGQPCCPSKVNSPHAAVPGQQPHGSLTHERYDEQAIVTTTGWRPTCTHNHGPVPQTVLDPFSGAGTTGQVAERLDRKYIGIELNPAYAEMGMKRIESAEMPLFREAPCP